MRNLDKFIKEGFVEKSPYSESYYICKKVEDINKIDWNSKPNNSLRIADHWNFKSEGSTHCKLEHTTDYTTELLVCVYNEITKKYKVLLQGDDAEKARNLLRETYKDRYNYRLECERKIRVRERKKEERELKKYIKEFLETLHKRKKDIEKLKFIINEKEIRMTQNNHRKYSDTYEYRIFKKYKFLFKNSKYFNDAPQGGRLGDCITLSKRDVNRIKKAMGEM